MEEESQDVGAGLGQTPALPWSLLKELCHNLWRSGLCEVLGMTKGGKREFCDGINFPSVWVEGCSLSLQRQEAASKWHRATRSLYLEGQRGGRKKWQGFLQSSLNWSGPWEEELLVKERGPNTVNSRMVEGLLWHQRALPALAAAKCSWLTEGKANPLGKKKLHWLNQAEFGMHLQRP